MKKFITVINSSREKTLSYPWTKDPIISGGLITRANDSTEKSPE